MKEFLLIFGLILYCYNVDSQQFGVRPPPPPPTTQLVRRPPPIPILQNLRSSFNNDRIKNFIPLSAIVSLGEQVNGLSLFQTWDLISRFLPTLKPHSTDIISIQPSLLKGIPTVNITQAIIDPQKFNVLKALMSVPPSPFGGMLISQQGVIVGKLYNRLGDINIIHLILQSPFPSNFVHFFNPRVISKNIGVFARGIQDFTTNNQISNINKVKSLPPNFQSILINFFNPGRNTTSLQTMNSDQISLTLFGTGCEDLNSLSDNDIIPFLRNWKSQVDIMKRNLPGFNFPINLRHCGMEAILRHLKNKKGNASNTTGVNVLSHLSLGEIDALGGELFTGIPLEGLENIPEEIQTRILFQIAQIQMDELLRLCSMTNLQWYSKTLFGNLIKIISTQQIQTPSQSRLSAPQQLPFELNTQFLTKLGNLYCYADIGSSNVTKEAIMGYLQIRSNSLSRPCCWDVTNQDQWAILLKKVFGDDPSTWKPETLAMMGDLMIAFKPDEIDKIPTSVLSTVAPKIIKTSAINLKVQLTSTSQPVAFARACLDKLSDFSEYRDSYKALMRKLAISANVFINTIQLSQQQQNTRRIRREINPKNLKQRTQNPTPEHKYVRKTRQALPPPPQYWQSPTSNLHIHHPMNPHRIRRQAPSPMPVSPPNLHIHHPMNPDRIRRQAPSPMPMSPPPSMDRPMMQQPPSSMDRPMMQQPPSSMDRPMMQQPPSSMDRPMMQQPPPSMDRSMMQQITCMGIKIADQAAIGLTLKDFETMKLEDLINCIETIGNIDWNEEMKKSLFQLYNQKINLTTIDKLNVLNLLELGSLVSEISTEGHKSFTLFGDGGGGPDGSIEGTSGNFKPFDVSSLELTVPNNLDAISILGTRITKLDTLKAIADKFGKDNNLNNPMAGRSRGSFVRTTVWSLGNILCGLNEKVLKMIFDTSPTLFLEVSPMIGVLQSCDGETLSTLAHYAIQEPNYGTTDTWTKEDVNSIGVVVAGLTPEDFALIPPPSMQGLTALAARSMTPEQIQKLSPAHLSSFSYEAGVEVASPTNPHLTSALTPEQQSALTSVIYISREHLALPLLESSTPFDDLHSRSIGADVKNGTKQQYNKTKSTEPILDENGVVLIVAEPDGLNDNGTNITQVVLFGRDITGNETRINGTHANGTHVNGTQHPVAVEEKSENSSVSVNKKSLSVIFCIVIYYIL